MKPVEPGCLAVIINKPRRLIGREVEVIEWVHGGGFFTNLDGAVRQLDEAEGGWHTTDPDGGSCIFHPSQLIRIDGYEPVTTEEEQEVSA